ncbi:hypothetical protein JG687_00018878 [Phytophthora cactorum]|uniref:Uncharacterized protein n=1 Tax=Phytophthora cactorum TaxID=29920 RepID=A0A8T1TLR2_9STRA|nr:hypothetical protein GQ600_21806 [Phytophthora cactorum]KAG6942763.1 hypothetical protein JG687_00018878 [Phytophthora cactorum]
MGMEEFNTDDEERASFMANIVEQAKAYYYGIKVGLNPHTESKWVMRYEDELETPASIRALYLDRKGILADRYKGWYDNKNKLAANKLARN